MKVEILGMGCPNCKALEEKVKEAAKAAGIKADIKKVTDINGIVSYGVMATPALVIGGKVKCSGRIPEQKEIEGWLKK